MYKLILGVALATLLPVTTNAMSCVRYVHYQTGGAAPLVNAEFYAGFLGSMMSVGSVVVLHYPDSDPEYQWHVAMVEGFKPDCLQISERNFDGEGSYSARCISYNDKAIYKFWSPTGASFM